MRGLQEIKLGDRGDLVSPCSMNRRSGHDECTSTTMVYVDIYAFCLRAGDKMHPNSIDKTTFVTKREACRCNTMSLGLQGSPGII